MFHAERCDFCGECLNNCYYMNFGLESGGEAIGKLVAGEKAEWLNDCVTCMACNEYCSKGARPFDLILGRLEEKGDFIDEELVTEMKERFTPKNGPKPVEINGPVISLCVMTGNAPWAFQGQLFENVTILKGLPYFCNVLFAHMGNETIMRERLQSMVDNLAASGAKEIVLVHEDCYAVLTDIAAEYGIVVPFRPLHLFEYLRDYLGKHPERITKLNLRVAYQRPCASRHTPKEIENVLYEVFDLIGVERVVRQYDGVNAICCGVEVAGPNKKLFPRGKNFEPFRDKNVKDAKNSGAEAMVYLCPLCFQTLSGKSQALEMKNYMVTDLCRLALGEKLPEDKPK